MKAYVNHTSITVASILILSIFFIVKYFSFYGTTYPATTITTAHQHQLHLTFYSDNITAIYNNTAPSPPTLLSPTELSHVPVVERTGIVDENGVMRDDFIVGEFDEGLIDSVVNLSDQDEIREDISVGTMKIERFKVCDESMIGYIPGTDNIQKSNSSGLDCLVPRPKGYKLHIPWPKSRDMVWFDNVPLTLLDQEKGGEIQLERKEDQLIFPVERIQFMNGVTVNQYLDEISKMAPKMEFGKCTRVALDINCGVASFGAHLMEHNVTTLSVSSKDIQFALERGVPAMIAILSKRRLLYPSQAFDFIHCSSCKINWTTNDGILLLEVNRVLRGGGYFVWSAETVNKHETDHLHQWKEMENLTRSLCWELIKIKGYIAIWQKPVDNTCYLSRDHSLKPSLCDETDNPDDVWGVNLTRCITRLPDNGYGSNVTRWPERLHTPPQRLSTIQMDAYLSRRDIYKAESKYWNDIVKGYIDVFHLKQSNIRNVMDMNSRYGGFAAALLDFQVDSWVMNVVPVSGSNTLSVLYDRGLIGVLHDWCDSFDTYPRTYDFLNAAGLFSLEKQKQRCNISTIMLEMDRILRPGGRVYIRDIAIVIDELEVIAKAMGWVTFMFDAGEGPHSNWKFLNCEKRL